jgi:hypothetical protein
LLKLTWNFIFNYCSNQHIVVIQNTTAGADICGFSHGHNKAKAHTETRPSLQWTQHLLLSPTTGCADANYFVGNFQFRTCLCLVHTSYWFISEHNFSQMDCKY